MDNTELLKKVQSLQRRIKRCSISMNIDYTINDAGRSSIDVYVHSGGAHCERFTFSCYSDNDFQMIYLKEHLKEIRAFKNE